MACCKVHQVAALPMTQFSVQAEQMYNARYRPDQYQAPPQGYGYGLGRSCSLKHPPA